MKLFNKKRFQLFKGTRFQKYIAYAIGEIILVIVGILIALGISNWRQNKILSDTNEKLQNNVLVQLDKDIIALDDFAKDLDTLNQTYLSVLGREFDRSKVDLSGVVSTVLFEVNSLALDQHITNMVENAQLDNSIASQELIETASHYRMNLKEIKEIEDIIYAKITKNLEEIESTESWYTALITDFQCGNECIAYLTNNENHKARVASLRFLYDAAYGQLIDSFKDDLIESKENLVKSMKTIKS